MTRDGLLEMDMRRQPARDKWPTAYFAHRGGLHPGTLPNSTAAFEKAIEKGAPAVEMDARLFEGEVRIGHGEAEVNSGQSPSLAEVLDAIGTKIGEREGRPKPIVNIELKEAGTAMAVLSLLDKYVLEKGWNYNDFLISAFTKKSKSLIGELEIVKEDQRCPIAICTSNANYVDDHIKVANGLEACSIHIDARTEKGKFEKFTSQYIDKVHSKELCVYPWTINGEEEMRQLGPKHVDGIFTDDINLARRFFPSRASDA